LIYKLFLQSIHDVVVFIREKVFSWKGGGKKKRPECLEKRFEFQSYEKNRDFLDALGEYCEKVNRFPDISFGKTYANITIRPEENNVKEEISKDDHDFASEIDFLNKQEEN
jgi:pterin-4a-carbinolamine dehydratase